ncbi:MAG: hypothetical protein L3J21_09915 [Devosiaceae bacterium]|nr:hypothetical protein [Devosiaceae bacterium]
MKNIPGIYKPTPDEILRRKNIVDLESTIEKEDGSLGNDPFPLKHHFAPGVYAREILLPAGTITVGKIHRHDHLIIFLFGDVTISSEKGEERITTPGVAISPVGIKRALYAHKDTAIVTIHVTSKTDMADIEREVIAPNFNVLDFENQKIEVK